MRARRVLVPILFAVGLSAAAAPDLPSVETLQLSGLDFTHASVHQAGPDSFYIRSVRVDGELYSFLLRSTDGLGWEVASIVPEDANLLPPQTVLDFAVVSVDGSVIRIDGVFLEGALYGGALAPTADGGLELAGAISVTTIEAVNQTRFRAFQELAQAATREEFESRLAELRSMVTDLERERTELAHGVINLIDENNEQRSEIWALRDQIETLVADNTSLREDLNGMASEVGRLQALVETFRSAEPAVEPAVESVVAPPVERPPAEWALPADYVRTADLQAAARDVTRELQRLESRLAALEAAAVGLAGLEELLRSPPPPPESPPPPEPRPATREEAEAALARAEQAELIARLQAQVADLRERNQTLRDEQRLLEERVLREILDHGLVAIMERQLTRRLVTGFSGALPDTGSWSISPTVARQTDRDAFFAKAALPLDQGRLPVLYEFTVRSLDEGWVGVGLHLFVTDVERRRGYGMGSSLLVWFTRDPAVHRNQLTYLQLYRSDDDVNMGRVLDAVLQEPISQPLRVQVLYEPESQYLTVAVNGVDRVRYRTWFGIGSGVEIALRSLGRAEFSALSVHTAP